MKFEKLFKVILEQSEAIVLLPGGFKPPHKGHFEALKFLLKKANTSSAKVFVGKKERDGITQDQAIKIWEVYKKYLPQGVEIVGVTGSDKAGRDATPLSMTYDFIDNNKNLYKSFFVGAGEEDLARFKGLEKDKQTYPNTMVISIPPQFNRISGTQTRKNIITKADSALSFIPDEVKERDQVRRILGI
jgi:hypothetical protein